MIETIILVFFLGYVFIALEHNFKIDFTNLSLERNTEYEVGLVKASIWYSFHNISTSFSNNTIQYSHDNGATFTTITFPNGLYSIDAINQYVQAQMLANGHVPTVNGALQYNITITPNYSTLKVDVTLTNNYQLKFNSDVNELLGFDNTQQTVTSTTSGNNVANITRSVNSLSIKCSIATGSWENSTTSDVIYTFVYNVTPGSLQEVFPNQILYVPINTYNEIHNIRMRITDQLGREVDLNNEPTTFLLHLRKQKK